MSGRVVSSQAGRPAFLGRYQKPSFKYENPKAVVVPASVNKPAYFVIDGTPYTVTSDLTCSCTSLVANKCYYLYAVESSGAVALTYDAADPEIGPGGRWTYLGAFATDQDSAILVPFQSSNGRCILEAEIETETHTGDTLSTAKTFESLPTTITEAYFRIIFAIVGSNRTGQITGLSSTTDLTLVSGSASSSGTLTSFGWVPIFESQTVYLRTSHNGSTVSALLHGWIENPSEYK